MLGNSAFPDFPHPNGRVETMGGVPAPWAPNERGLVAGSAAFVGLVGFSVANVANSAYWDGASWRRMDANAPTIYQQAAGAHKWYGDAAGVSGVAYTPTERMRLDVNGNLGVGMTPSFRVDVSGTQALSRFRATVTDVSVNSLAAAELLCDSSDVLLMAHSSARTTSRFGLTLGGWCELSTFDNTGTTNGLVVGTTTAKPLVFGTNSAERVRIDSSGNVGIGVIPSYRFAAATGGLWAAQVINNNAVETHAVGLRAPTDVASDLRCDITFGTTVGSGGSDSYIAFNTNHYGVAYAERARIDRDGNMTVVSTGGYFRAGATTAQMDFNGFTPGSMNLYSDGQFQPQFALNGWFTGASATYFIGARARGSRASPGPAVNGDGVLNVLGTARNAAGSYVNACNISYFLTAAESANQFGADMTFQTSKEGVGLTEWMRITHLGNVGIGVTPNSFSPLHVRSGSAAFGMLRLQATAANGEASIGYCDDGDSNSTTWVVGKNVGVTDDSFRWYYNGSLMFLDTSGNLSAGGSVSDSKGDVRGIPQNSQSVAYTLVLSDAGKHILHPSADTTARTFTIPANASVAFPIGTAVTFVNESGAGTLTIAITTDTMRLAGAGTTGSRTLAANGIATALKVTATEWIISGTNLT